MRADGRTRKEQRLEGGLEEAASVRCLVLQQRQPCRGRAKRAGGGRRERGREREGERGEGDKGGGVMKWSKDKE